MQHIICNSFLLHFSTLTVCTPSKVLCLTQENFDIHHCNVKCFILATTSCHIMQHSSADSGAWVGELWRKNMLTITFLWDNLTGFWWKQNIHFFSQSFDSATFLFYQIVKCLYDMNENASISLYIFSECRADAQEKTASTFIHLHT